MKYLSTRGQPRAPVNAPRTSAGTPPPQNTDIKTPRDALRVIVTMVRAIREKAQVGSQSQKV